MSTYRGYVPWKSSLSTSTYQPKTDAASRYSSSRDDVTASSDVKSTPRFGSIASPTTYRPSYSGGTYHSSKRESTPSVSTYSSANKYASTTSTSKDATKEKEATPTANSSSTIKKLNIQNSKYGPTKSSATTSSAEPKPTRYSSTSSLCNKSKLRDPSPIVERRSTLDVSTPVRNRDPSPATSTTITTRRTRDPSPATSTTGRRLSVSTVRTRDISPASSSLYIRSRSRDPSPAESYKGSSRFTSSNLKNYGGGNSYTSSLSKPRKEPIPYTTNPLGSRSTGLSYLTASEASARISSRRAEREEKKLKSAETEREPPREKASVIAVRSVTLDAKPEEMIQVSVVTRGTSPTPPNAAPNFVRPTRRIDNAKTIEKIIQRPAKRPNCEDKEIQSDRLDDTSKYSRFKSSRIASWTSFLDNKYVTSSTTPTTNTATNTASQSGYSRLSNSSSSKSGNLVKSDSSESVKKVKSKDSSSSSSSSTKSNSSVSKSGSSKSVTKSEKSKGESKSKSTSSSTKATGGSSKQKSPDSSKSLPPLAPKADSPTKTIIPTTSDSPKWTNKDFRKSVLNIGPTDRPRKSRASSESETENPSEKSNQQQPNNASQQNERSPSVSSSEFSSTSAATTTNSEEENTKSVKIKSSPSQSSFVINNNIDTTTTTGDEPVNNNVLQVTKTCNDICTNYQPSSTSSSAKCTVSSSQNNVSGAKSSADAKSFLIRTLGPVTNILFKSKSQSSSLSSPQLQQAQQLQQDTGYNDDNNSTSISESLEQDTQSIFLATKSETKFENDNNDPNCNGQMYLNEENTAVHQQKSSEFGTIATHKLRHIDSGDLSSWWCTNDNNDDDDEDDDTVANDITLNQSDLSEISEQNKSLYKIRHIESGEKAWWMNDNSSKENSIPKNVVAREPSIANSENREWWLDTTDSKSSNNTDLSNHQNSTAAVAPPPPPPPLYRIRHIESGEKAWWMNSDNTSEKDNKSKVSNKSSTSNSISDKRPKWYAQTPPKDTINSESSKPLGKYRIRHIESGEKAWWMQDDKTEETNTVNEYKTDWNNQQPFEQIKDGDEPPLGDRASPEGLEDTTNKSINSAYDNKDRVKNLKKLFISRHTNIDDLLGGSSHPLSPLLLDCFESDEPFEKITPDQVRIHEGTAPGPLDKERLHSRELRNPSTAPPTKRNPLDDATLQIYKDGDYGAYLDLESSLAEQSDDIDGLQSSRKNSLVVRTQLSVRVHTIIEKLLTSQGRDLRRGLFSLKQIFQEDKDLVHGFVALGGLNCLVQVGSGADQNYQNYILRALGQVMLYVDGMNGVMKHGPTIQWLYSLIASKYRLVVKTALKLLLVFVEYIESNSYLLVNAIHAVDGGRRTPPWSNIMKLLKDYENSDTELLIYATSLINKTLSGLSDQDSFYDESDFLEQQGIENVVQRYMSRPGTDLDLLDQLQLYEAVLKFEDGEIDGIRIPDNSVRKTLRYRASNINTNDPNERRKSRRHSTGTSPVKHQLTPTTNNNSSTILNVSNNTIGIHQTADEDSSSSANSGELNDVFNVAKQNRESAGVTPGLRRRRERAERQKTFIREQQEAAAAAASSRPLDMNNGDDLNNGHGQLVTAMPVRLEIGHDPETGINVLSTSSMNNTMYHNANLQQHIPIARIGDMPTQFNDTSPIIINSTKDNRSNGFKNKLDMKLSNDVDRPSIIKKAPDLTNGNEIISQKEYEIETNRLNGYNASVHSNNGVTKNGQNNFTNGNANVDYNYSNGMTNGSKPKNNSSLSNGTSMNGNQNHLTNTEINGDDTTNENEKLLLQLKRDHTVKNITQKLSNLPISPQDEKPTNRIIGDMSGLISKAKEGLAKSKSKGDISRSPSVDQEIKKPTESKKSENELHWEELVQNMDRPLMLCDLDFTDLQVEDDKDNLAPRGLGGSVPPPPPIGGPAGVVAPPPMMMNMPPPMMKMNIPPPMTNLGSPQMYSSNNNLNGQLNGGDANGSIKKAKKTVKLFWKEVREDMIPIGSSKTIWDELPQSNIDVQKLEHLFESRAKDLVSKKQQEINKNKEIIVLDHKRSNAINIAMTKLPPPRAIKAAILKMDATVVTREGIDKLLNMLPSDEERGKIQEAQVLNPELPLGSAEQFLLTLSSISELAARLKLWAFKLDFEISEKEIAEPLMDLKQGIETLKTNKTFKCILSTLLSIGIFLNGAPVKGFQIEYLAKVPEVKDTVQKHSLLHHLCHMVMETSPETSDLYSEIGPITRASKADFTDLAHNIGCLEKECKASWDRLKLIAKHDCPPQLKQKMIDFLADCAERIIILDIVHRRVINRYRKFLLWLGVPQHRILESKPNEVCRIVSEFALEYRTTRERVQQQIEKKANHRERNKTRGKMIVDVTKFRTQEDRADAELRQLLGTPKAIVENIESPSGTLTWRRRRPDNQNSPKLRLGEENLTDGDDEILESLVKTATKATGPRQTPRERKRTRHADRKSLRRTLKNGITEEELQLATEIMKNF